MNTYSVIIRRKIGWKLDNLAVAVKSSRSIRQVLKKLNLRQAGGNYSTVKHYIKRLKLDVSHFKGRGWNRGLSFPFKPKIDLSDILKNPSQFQSYKLKQRLIRAGLKKEECQLCGWKQMAIDGRVPLELDHINGNRFDNRIENLRILCPNCHSLQSTHRGRNHPYGNT